MRFLTVGTETNHAVDDRECPECWEDYPEPCRCGGLMHAAGGEEDDQDGEVWLTTKCDRCGRSEEDLEQP
jgi:hypothetical protein